MKTTSQKLLNSINVDNHTVDQALSRDHEVVQCSLVRGGHSKSKYEDWIQHSKPSVRKLIADNYPEYIPLLPCKTEWELTKVERYLLERIKPKIDVLKKFLSKIEPSQNHNTEVIALQLKYETMVREMTTIEKTMNLKQLWQSDSPFWADSLSGEEIVDLLCAYNLSDESLEEFDFEQAYNTVKNPFHKRLNNYIPFAVAKLSDKILNEEPQCHKILTPLLIERNSNDNRHDTVQQITRTSQSKHPRT